MQVIDQPNLRQRNSELLQQLVQPISSSLTPGDMMQLMQDVVGSLPLGVSEHQACEVLRGHVESFGASLASRLAVPSSGQADARVSNRQRYRGDGKRHVLHKVLSEIREFVFPGFTDAEIDDGTAQVTVMFLSDADIWSESPGNNENQPAGNLVLFHSSFAVLFTSHIPHC